MAEGLEVEGGGYSGEVLAHHVAHRDRVHHGHLATRLQGHAAARQILRVDRLRIEHARHHGAHGTGEEHREDDLVGVGDLEQQEHRGERRVHRRGQERPHPNQGIGADRCGEVGEEVVDDAAVGPADHRADEQRRAEHSPRAAGA